jgi:hypothetical protein
MESITIRAVSAEQDGPVKEGDIGTACNTNKTCEMHERILKKSERKRSFGRPSRGCENNINVGLKDIEYGAMDWII